jgi:DNA-binding NarL/FixJ family response regulator
MRIVLADDDAAFRTCTRDALEARGWDVCGEAANATEAVRLALALRPDVALLDIQVPGNGIRAAREISRWRPEVAVVMLTASREDDDLFDSLRAGAAGYLPKDGDPSMLSSSLLGVLAGEAAIPADLVTRILSEFRGPTHRRFPTNTVAARRLSAREWEVMELLSQGHSTDVVGKRLFVSPTTVRVHVSAVLRKLAVKDRASAFQLLLND